EVDHPLRRVEPHPQHRQQALAAGDDLGLVTVLGERRQGLLQGGRGQVVELGRDHDSAPSVRSAVPWFPDAGSKCGAAASVVGSPPPPPESWIARQTRSGVHGIWMSLMPKWRMASTTALTTAGVEAMVPASPTPLVPSVFVVAGVVV